ncbi:MAG: DNA-3-methyladenine glycosylase 2 family protein [Chloroflexi bacterium]|nr:DNA-3-methyladenine glycosylase 2 family protein [Chloroflexota bacterium]
MEERSLTLTPVPPFRLDHTVWALRRRPDNIVDRWDGETYRRVLVDDEGRPFEISVRQSGSMQAPQLYVSIQAEKTNQDFERQATMTLERVLGLNLRLDDFYRLAVQDENLKLLAEKFQGFKPTRYPTYFETLVNAIACQQLTLTMGIRILNELVKAYGLEFRNDSGVYYAFPRPQDLASADIEDLRRMKFSYQNARYITGIAQLIVDGALDLEAIELLDDQDAIDRLCELKGVGRWTAEYYLLRGLGRTHIFPGDDVGGRNHLQRWLGLPDKLDHAGVNQVLLPWQDYGGLVYFHLLMKGIDEKSMRVISKESL